jgi:hypothetical protein
VPHTLGPTTACTCLRPGNLWLTWPTSGAGCVDDGNHAREVVSLLSCRAMSLSMLWELRMSDLHPLLNSHPHLQHDLCADVIEVHCLKFGSACLLLHCEAGAATPAAGIACQNQLAVGYRAMHDCLLVWDVRTRR